MHTFIQILRSGMLGGLALLLLGCGPDQQELPWRQVQLAEVKLRIDFPCEPEVGRTKVDFGMGDGPVLVSMMGAMRWIPLMRFPIGCSRMPAVRMRPWRFGKRRY